MTLEFLSPVDTAFVVGITLSIIAGLITGVERELRHKDAGISTHILVIVGAMVFTHISVLVDPASTSRIAAQIVTGIGFLGAGLILKEAESVRNLTTAASMWLAAAVGMAFGYGLYSVGIVATLVAVLVPRIPKIYQRNTQEGKGDSEK